MEGRQVVADVDAYEEADTDEGADEDEDVNSLSQCSHASKFKVKGGMPRIVRGQRRQKLHRQWDAPPLGND